MRNGITTEARESQSIMMSDRLTRLDVYNNALSILAFVSFGTEINTKSIIEKSWSQNKIIACPITDNKHKNLSFREALDWNDFEIGYSGILEPKDSCRKIDISTFDLILVPGMAFDTYGFRMGYGGGFYDRILPNINSNSTILSPAFDDQVFDTIPHCKHDQQIDMIVTDKRVIYCNNKNRPECPEKSNSEICPES